MSSLPLERAADAAPPAPSRRLVHPATLLQTLRDREPVLAATGIAVLLAIVPLLLAQAIDTRTLAGVDVWQKPLKFHVALGIYALTLAGFAGWISAETKATRTYRVYSVVVALCILFELFVIDGAVAAGTTSHFNIDAPLFPFAYPLMGVGAVTLTSMSLVQGVLLARRPGGELDPVIRRSLVAGLCLTFLATLLVAGYLSSGSGHLVGGNGSDIEALPLTGWARDGGDLRVAHFFASHALHAIPLFGWLVARRASAPVGRALVGVFSVAYAVLIALTFAQALAGRPFLAGL